MIGLISGSGFYALAAFAIDYASGVRAEPTSVEALNENLKAGTNAFRLLLERLPSSTSEIRFKNHVYRFSA